MAVKRRLAAHLAGIYPASADIFFGTNPRRRVKHWMVSELGRGSSFMSGNGCQRRSAIRPHSFILKSIRRNMVFACVQNACQQTGMFSVIKREKAVATPRVRIALLNRKSTNTARSLILIETRAQWAETVDAVCFARNVTYKLCV